LYFQNNSKEFANSILVIVKVSVKALWTAGAVKVGLSQLLWLQRITWTKSDNSQIIIALSMLK